MPRPHHFVRLALRSIPFRIGVILLALSLPLLIPGYNQVAPGWRLTHTGVVTQGFVVGKRIEHVTRKGKNGRLSETTTYLLTFQFATPGGDIVEGRQPLDQVRWKSYKEGERVPVRYLPDAPGNNRLEGEPAPASAWRTAAAGGGMLAGAVVLLVAGIARTRRAMHDART